MSLHLPTCSTTIPIDNGITKSFGPVKLTTNGTHIETIIEADTDCTLVHQYLNGNGTLVRTDTFSVLANTEHVFKSTRKGLNLKMTLQNSSGTDQTSLSMESFATDSNNSEVSIVGVVNTIETHIPVHLTLHTGTLDGGAYSTAVDVSSCAQSTLIYADTSTGSAVPVHVYVCNADTSMALLSELYPTSDIYHSTRTTSETIDLRPFTQLQLFNPSGSGLTNVVANLFS